MIARWLFLLLVMAHTSSAWASDESNIALLIQSELIDSIYVKSVNVKGKSPDRDVNLSATLGLIDDVYMQDEFAGLTLYRFLLHQRNKVELTAVLRDGQLVDKTYAILTPKDRRYRASPLMIKALSAGTTLRTVQEAEHIVMQHHGGDAANPEDYRKSKEGLKSLIYQQFLNGTFTSTEIFYSQGKNVKTKKARYSLTFEKYAPGFALLKKEKGTCKQVPLSFFHTEKNKFMGGVTRYKKACHIPKLGNSFYITLQSENTLQLKQTKGSGFMVFVKEDDQGDNKDVL